MHSIMDKDNNFESSSVESGGLKCLMIIASYYRIPADKNKLVHSIAVPEDEWTKNDIIRAAKMLEIKSAAVYIKREKLSKAVLLPDTQTAKK